MKKVIGMLALLALVGNIANAELLKNFKYDGKIVINAAANNNQSDANSDAKDKTSDVNAGVYLNAGFDLTEDVEAVVSAVKCSRQYGTGSESVAAGTADGFFMDQAYLNLKGVLGIDHKIGRQYYGEEGSLVVYVGVPTWPYKYSNNGNPLSAGGLDGWTGWYNSDKLAIHAIAAKKTDTDNGAGNPDTDVDVNGVVGKYNLMELLNIGAYVYEQKTYTAANADTTLDVVGVKGDGKIEALGLSYYGEIAKNYGRKAAGVNYTGSAILLGAKMEMDLVGKWTFMGEMARGSGDKASATKDEDFTAIASDYRPGIIYGGIVGNSGLANATTWNLGAKWNTPMFEKLTLSGKLFHFATTEDVTVGVNKYDTYGNELDLCAKWQHNENVGLKAYYAMMMVDGDYADAVLGGKDDTMTTIGAALTVKF